MFTSASFQKGLTQTIVASEASAIADGMRTRRKRGRSPELSTKSITPMRCHPTPSHGESMLMRAPPFLRIGPWIPRISFFAFEASRLFIRSDVHRFSAGIGFRIHGRCFPTVSYVYMMRNATGFYAEEVSIISCRAERRDDG